MGVPSAVKPFRNERANPIGSRERANDTDLELGDLTVEVPRAQALAQKFRFADLRFTQCILVSTRLLPGSRSIVATWSDRSVLRRAGLRFVRSPPPCRAFTALRFYEAV